MSKPTTEAGKRLVEGTSFIADLTTAVTLIEAEAREQVLISPVEALRLRDEYTDPFEAGRATGHHEAGKYGEFKRADLAKRIEERLRSSDIRDIDDIEKAVSIVREEAER